MGSISRSMTAVINMCDWVGMLTLHSGPERTGKADEMFDRTRPRYTRMFGIYHFEITIKHDVAFYC